MPKMKKEAYINYINSAYVSMIIDTYYQYE